MAVSDFCGLVVEQHWCIGFGFGSPPPTPDFYGFVMEKWDLLDWTIFVLKLDMAVVDTVLFQLAFLGCCCVAYVDFEPSAFSGV